MAVLFSPILFYHGFSLFWLISILGDFYFLKIKFYIILFFCVCLSSSLNFSFSCIMSFLPLLRFFLPCLLPPSKVTEWAGVSLCNKQVASNPVKFSRRRDKGSSVLSQEQGGVTWGEVALGFGMTGCLTRGRSRGHRSSSSAKVHTEGRAPGETRPP